MLVVLQVKLIAPQEVIFAADRGKAVIVDVRPAADYEKVST